MTLSTKNPDAARATLPAIALPRAAPRRSPVVLIDGVPEPGLSVARYTASAPLDRRGFELGCEGDPGGWAGRSAVVGYPLRLSDQSVRWPVLGEGRLRVERTREADRAAQRRLVLVETWDDLLERPIPVVWWRGAEGALIAQTTGALEPGLTGNRGAPGASIGGQVVSVLVQRGGTAWTLGAALASVSAFAGLGLSAALVPPALARAPLREAVDLEAPLARVLQKLLEPEGLTIQRELTRRGARLVRRKAVRAMGRGRPITPAPGSVTAVTRRPAAPRARPWVARGGRPVVESTFILHGDWDPALAHQPDARYGRDTSTDFPRYRGVFRRWALNEDGRLSPATPPLDLTALFGLGVRIRPTPLVLGQSVSVDGGGDPIPPMVEASTDGGASWARWGGQAVIEPDHAGVYLADATLPPAFLSAAKAGRAAVRVTASLTSPRPTTQRRWRGNPFAGVGPAVHLDPGERFPWRRVAPGSVHAVAGLASTAVDKRADLARWLVRRLDEADAAGQGDEEATRTLSGARPLIRVGDRIGEPAIHASWVDRDFLRGLTTVRG